VVLGELMTDILFREESYAIVGAAMEVYNQLGNGFLEAVYQEALAIEFAARGIPFQDQVVLEIAYKGKPLQATYKPDFIVYGQIIVELKAIKELGNNEQAQLLNYLKATNLKLGILLNFGAERQLERKRLVL
jgi:GxxExxY protein